MRTVTRLIAILALTLLLPATADAEPIKLKFSFFTSDRSIIYQNQIKPFVDAVNKDGRGLVEIEMYFSGSITKASDDQPRLVADGVADFAIISPGRTPDMAPDTAVVELPGLFRDQREGSLVFTRLIERGALKGYEKFYVVGAFVTDPGFIHSRKPIASLKDLKGLTIRTNDQFGAAVLERLGAKAIPLAINLTMEAISEGKIDGAKLAPSVLFEFGVGRVAKYHYLIGLGGVPTVLIMNRGKFESLPPRAQAIIRKYSGDWPAEHSAAAYDVLDKAILVQLQSDARRTVVFPSPSDEEIIQRVFASVIADWAAQSAHNRELLALVRAEIAKLRTRN